MEVPVSTARRSVNALKGCVRKKAEYLFDLCKPGRVRSDKEQSEVKLYSKSFYELVSKLEEANYTLQMVVEEEELNSVQDDAEKFVREWISPVNFRIEAVSGSADGAPSTSSQVDATRLPKLELPTFSGCCKQWTSFWEQYCVAVHDSDLADVSKFVYLKSLLKGEAREVIEGLALSSANYETACKLLEDRFGRKEKIIFCHIQDLLNLSIPVTTDIKRLWSFYNTLCSHVRSLEALGVNGGRYGVILTPLVLSRLPLEMRMEWARGGEGREADLDFLIDFLKSDLERRERSHPGVDGQLDAPSSTAAALHSGGKAKPAKGKGNGRGRGKQRQLSPTSYPTKCPVCDGAHDLPHCSTLLGLPVNKRYERLREVHVCFRCLFVSHSRGDHDFGNCNRKCSSCSGKHHPILCDNTNTDKHTSSSVNISASSFSASSVTHTDTLLQTIEVSVRGRGGRSKAVILFDTGSNRSYITEELVGKIKPDWVENCVLSYASFGSVSNSKPTQREIYDVLLEGMNSKIPINVTCLPLICAPVSQPAIPDAILSQIPNAVRVPTGSRVKIDMLIGLDVYWKLMGRDIEFVAPNLVLQDTLLGKVLSGVVNSNASMFCQGTTLHCQAENFWSLETIGISADEEPVVDSVQAHFTASVTRSEDRYSVSLPWKEGMKPKLLSNRACAAKRLQSLSLRLNRDEELRAAYDTFFLDMLKQGIVEEVPETEPPGPVFYLPHHPVVKTQSTSTKVRPVFDASCKGYNGVSLNDCMETGPNLLPDLPALLLRFRRWKIALTADIQKAFLQVGVTEEDRDVHRFLWQYEGRTRDMRFTRVPFGNKASPFLLMATIKHHLYSLDSSPAVDELLENLYMDDLVSGCESEELAEGMFTFAQSVMSEAGMVLTKWGSNSQSLQGLFGEDASGGASLGVLGLRWSPGTDDFSFTSPQMPPAALCVTKRVLLSIVSSVFDPLGLINPFTVRAKCLFQSVWRMKLDWDEVLPEGVQNEFKFWLEEFKDVRNLSVPRRYFSFLWTSQPSFVLHAFGDASEVAYGACVYLLATAADGSVESALLMSRARVAPIKSVSLPRLELLAAVLCARLVSYVKKALKLPVDQKVVCWTDSTVTLAWIQKEPSNWKVFVGNRVATIQALVGRENWHHCPGTQNPADLVTRGIAAKELVGSDLWLRGPVQLMVEGPSDTAGAHTTDEEVRTSCTLVVPSVAFQPIFDVERFSSFLKAIRVVAYVLKFIQCLKSPQSKGQIELSVAELNKGKVTLLEQVQRLSYESELSSLQDGRTVSKGSSLHKLSPILGEDGLLRVGGRLQFAGLAEDAQHPVIVPRGHLSVLLARHTHVAMKHAGVNSMLVQLRNDYWVVGARRTCKTVKRTCVSCQRFDGRAPTEPMAPLPKERVTPSAPFAVTGLDHFGPLYCADFPGEKFYVLLFTCAAVRAIHLELVSSLTQTETLLAIRRFIARRGMPVILWSDNAKSFQGAQRLLVEALGDGAPEWRFITPRAPWWGGWWERLVGSVKSALRKSLGRQRLCWRELETILHEVEGCINSRPLTFVGDGPESDRQLTPAHFLVGRRSPNFKPVGDFSRSDRDGLVELDRQQAGFFSDIWKVWQEEYVRNLPPVRGKGGGREMAVGTVVLIEEDIPKSFWPLGVIVRVIPGRDDIVRSVEIQTSKGIITRPIQRLRQLEFEIFEVDSLPSSSFSPPEESLLHNTQTPPIHNPTPPTPTTPQVGGLPARNTRCGRSVKVPQRLDL